jgi:hypothetical protein
MDEANKMARAEQAKVIEHQPSFDHQAPEIARDADLIEPNSI